MDLDKLGQFINPIAARNQAVKVISEFGAGIKPWVMSTALHHWVHTNIKTVPDPRNIEYVSSVADTISILGGDALDKAILLCSLCEAVGIKSCLLALENSKGVYYFCLASVGSQVPQTTADDIGAFYKDIGITLMNVQTSWSQINNEYFSVLDPETPVIGDVSRAEKAGFVNNKQSSFEYIGIMHFNYWTKK